jgi:hypothetical protein
MQDFVWIGMVAVKSDLPGIDGSAIVFFISDETPEEAKRGLVRERL